MQIPIIKGDKVNEDETDFRDALLVNYYAVSNPIRGAKGYILNFYGISSRGTGSGKTRGGIWVSRDGLEGEYRVSGNDLIKVDADGGVTVLGRIPGTDQASMTYSFNNIAIVANRQLFYYNPTDGLREITDSDVGEPLDIVWADNLFILTDGETLYHSNILDEELYEPLDFTGADFQPDSTRGVGLNEDNELIAFGQFTTEYFVNAGLDNFVYQRISLKAQKVGILGTHCKSELSDEWFCLARRKNTQPAFHILRSGTSEDITSREIEKILQDYTDEDLESAVVEVFSKNGTHLMIAHLPWHTLAYNKSIASVLGKEAAWFILKSDVLNEAPFRGKDVVYNPDAIKWTVGDRRDSRLGYLDDTVCTHYDDIVEGLFFTPTMPFDSLSIDEIRIETIPGNSPSNDATVFFSRTEDGNFYGNEYTIEYGMNFDRKKNFIARRLGYISNFTGLRFRTASRSRMAFCFLNVEAS